MGFKLVEAVYSNVPRNATSPTEQAVLVALAFRAKDNERHHACWPSKDMLSAMTHFGNSAIVDALNKLREKGYIMWESGGWTGARRKGMTVLSNKYYIKLPEAGKNDALPEKGSDRQADTAVSAKRTQLYTPGGHSCIRQTVTGVSARRSQTENNNNININPNRKESGSSLIRRDPGSGESKTLGQCIDAMGVDELTKPDCYSPNHNKPPHLRALEICGITEDNPEYSNYRDKFRDVITDLQIVRAHDVMDKVEGSIRQGELKSINNMGAFLMSQFNKSLASLRDANRAR